MSSRRDTRESSTSEVKSSSKSYDDDSDADDHHSHRPLGHDCTSTSTSTKEHRRRSRSRSRSPNRKRRSSSRERRRTKSRDRDRRRFHEKSKHGSRRRSSDRGKDEDRGSGIGHSHYRRRERRSSRSSSTERHERDRERSKLELRQQMARNYKEQIEKIQSNQYGPPPQPNKYPNQAPVDPSKLVEQIEKRKFLFSKKDKPAAEGSTTVWKNTAFNNDSDGKVSAKFKRLMGMKDGEMPSTVDEDQDSSKKRDEYLNNLEKQYEVARATTHTQRGLGLGFTSSRIFPLIPKP